MKKGLKLYLILLILAVLFTAPYLFRKNLCIQVAESYVNTPNEWTRGRWDTVFVNARPVNQEIELDDLTISDTVKYEVSVWKGNGKYNPKYENATIVYDDLFQLGVYANINTTAVAWEGTRTFRDRYIWVLFGWVRVSHELTGMA